MSGGGRSRLVKTEPQNTNHKTKPTEVYALPPDRLYASYFGGDEALGMAADEEARDLWLQFLPPERVLPFGKKENFWEVRLARASRVMLWGWGMRGVGS